MTERATGSSECKKHLASCICHILFNSVLYKPRCKSSMLSPTHRIICLPLLTWNDTGLGDPHPICDQYFFTCYPSLSLALSIPLAPDLSLSLEPRIWGLRVIRCHLANTLAAIVSSAVLSSFLLSVSHQG